MLIILYIQRVVLDNNVMKLIDHALGPLMDMYETEDNK